MRAPVRVASHESEMLPEEGPIITESTAPALRGLNLIHLDLDPTNSKRSTLFFKWYAF